MLSKVVSWPVTAAFVVESGGSPSGPSAPAMPINVVADKPIAKTAVITNRQRLSVELRRLDLAPHTVRSALTQTLLEAGIRSVADELGVLKTTHADQPRNGHRLGLVE